MIQGNSRQLKRSFVASTTSGTLSDKIVIFVLWLFDTRREFIVQDYIPEFEAMNPEDLIDFQRREEVENLIKGINRNQINERKGIQNMMGQIVDAINPSQSGISHNSLVKIDGEGTVTYEVV